MKKIIAIILCILFLTGMSAFAASAIQEGPDGSYTVTGTDINLANKQVTILVHSGSAISTESTQYIDQTTANDIGKYTFGPFHTKNPVSAQTGDYAVMIGNESSSTATKIGVISPLAGEGYVVQGKIEVLKNANVNDATISIYGSEGTLVATTVADATTGMYSFIAPAVLEVRYKFQVTRENATSYTDHGFYVSQDMVKDDIKLYIGKFEPSAPSIGINDITRIIRVFGQTGSNITEDLNKSSRVDIDDITAVIASYGKGDVNINEPSN